MSKTILKGFGTGKKSIIFNPKQKEYINALFCDGFKIRTDNLYKEFAFFGGFRSGKSYATQLSTWLINSNYGNVSSLYVRDTYAQLKDSVIPQFNDDFGNYRISPDGKIVFGGTAGVPIFTYKVTDREAIFANGSVIKFRAFDKDTNILSAEYDLIAVCQAEDIDYSLFLQLFGRLSGSNLPKRLLLTEGNPANTFVKARYKDRTKEQLDDDGIYFVEAPTKANLKNLDPDYLDRLYKTYPKNWINRYVDGGWDQIDEMVFSEFRDHHIIDPVRPDEHEEQVIGGDYGYRNPTAFLWLFKDYDDNYVIWDEFYEPEQTPEQIAEANKRHGNLLTIFDYSTKRPDSHGKSVWDMLIELGLWLYESNKDELRNITVINSLLKQGKIKITRNCVNVISEIRRYKWKRLKLGEDKNHPEQTVDKDNHAIDALLYAIAYLEDLYSKKPEVIHKEQTLQHITEHYDYGITFEDLG